MSFVSRIDAVVTVLHDYCNVTTKYNYYMYVCRILLHMYDFVCK